MRWPLASPDDVAAWPPPLLGPAKVSDRLRPCASRVAIKTEIRAGQLCRISPTKRQDVAMSYQYSRGWRGLTIAVVPPLSRAIASRDWRGMEHVPRSGGLIVAANHISEA